MKPIAEHGHLVSFLPTASPASPCLMIPGIERRAKYSKPSFQGEIINRELNSVGPDQMPQKVASDQGLHCLLRYKYSSGTRCLLLSRLKIISSTADLSSDYI